jgi:hypothetical protein
MRKSRLKLVHNANQNNPGQELTQRFCEQYRGLQAAIRTTILRAIDAGAVILQAIDQLEHGRIGPWFEVTSKQAGCSVKTMERYARIAKRVTEMPDLRPKILEMGIAEADDFLREEVRERNFGSKLDLKVWIGQFEEAQVQARHLFFELQQRFPHKVWATWKAAPVIEAYVRTDLAFPKNFAAHLQQFEVPTIHFTGEYTPQMGAAIRRMGAYERKRDRERNGRAKPRPLY